MHDTTLAAGAAFFDLYLADTTRQLVGAQQTVEALRNSTSCRITAPIRIVVGGLRRSTTVINL